jgi:hypothetical protein
MAWSGRPCRSALLKLALPPGERGDVAGQRAGGGRGTACPDRTGHGRARHGPAPRDRLEFSPRRAGQTQRIGQQPGGILPGRSVNASFQVTDRSRAQAGRPGQLLLGQPRLGPQPPQQRRKGHQTLIGHRPSLARRPASGVRQDSTGRWLAVGSLDSHLGGACTLILPGRRGPATRESA